MLLAIGQQESDQFRARRQYNDGPARGFWQFERGGATTGVLKHPLTVDIVKHVCAVLRYRPVPLDCWTAIEHNDTLACVFARLLLYTNPAALPAAHEYEKGWQQYLQSWRPGKPHRATWNAFYDEAWRVVTGG